jgi:Tfp pilus assembly protein PilX
LERRVTEGQRDASAAMVRASSALREAEGLRVQVSTTAEHLRRIRRRNHFSESIGELFGLPPR